MQYWMKRGFALKGTRWTGVYIASKKGKHAVLITNFFDELVHAGEEFFYTEEQANEYARELQLATV